MMGLTKLAKTVFLAGVLAVGGSGGYKSNQYWKASHLPAHVNDNIILELKEGRTLADAGVSRGENGSLMFTDNDLIFRDTYRIDDASSLGFPGVYVIDTQCNDDNACLLNIIEEFKEDSNDVLDAELDLQYSIPELESEKSPLQEWLENVNQKVNQYVPGLQKVIDAEKNTLEKIKQSVHYIVASEKKLQPREDINDPYYKEGKMPGQMLTGMDQMGELFKKYGKTADNLHRVKMYVLDTGCDADHEDLSVEVANGEDGHGHGTHVAGTIAALTNNETGISSIDALGVIQLDCEKVLSDQGRGSIEDIAKAIVTAVDEETDGDVKKIISMSLGGRGKSTLLEKVIKYAHDKGVWVVVAAGNDNADAKNTSPANVPEAITVGAAGYDGENIFRAPFSNFGETVDICAPGMNILSTVPGNGYKEYSGTSMATPQEAGTLAMMRAVNPELTQEEAVQIQQETGLDVQTEKKKPIGQCISSAAAVEKVLQMQQSKDEATSLQEYLNALNRMKELFQRD